MDIGNPLDFTGRVVLVTGGTKRIGAAIAEAFLAARADVVVCGRNAPDTPPAARGREAVFVPADVRDPSAAAGLVDSAVERFGRLDVLVNNAGGSPDADAATVSPRFVEKIVALNLLSPFYVAQGAHRFMRARPGAARSSTSAVSPPTTRSRAPPRTRPPRPGCWPSPRRWPWSGRPRCGSTTSPPA